MSYTMRVYKGAFTYYVLERTIQVCGVGTTQTIHFGRRPGEEDVEILHHLIKMGVKLQADLVQDALIETYYKG